MYDRYAVAAVNILESTLAVQLENLVTYEGDELLRAQGAARKLITLVREVSIVKPTA